MHEASPARLYALLAGALLTIGGLAGFFYSSSFETGPELPVEELLGIFAVNGWLNLLHLVTGLLGLIAAGYAARAYSIAIGVLYVAISIWGFAATDSGAAVILDALPLNTEDNVLHLVVGLLGVGAAAGSAPPRADRVG